MFVTFAGAGFMDIPFTPGPTATRSVTGTSAQATLGTGAGASGTPQVMVSALAANAIAFVKFGDSAVVATTADTPILPGTVQLFSPPAGTTTVAAIGTAASTLYFTVGHGV